MLLTWKRRRLLRIAGIAWLWLDLRSVVVVLIWNLRGLVVIVLLALLVLIIAIIVLMVMMKAKNHDCKKNENEKKGFKCANFWRRARGEIVGMLCVTITISHVSERPIARELMKTTEKRKGVP